MNAQDIQQLSGMLDEVMRINALTIDVQDKLFNSCCEDGISLSNGYAAANSLFDMLKGVGCDSKFLKDDGKLVSKNLFKLLLVHFKLKSWGLEDFSIANLTDFIQRHIVLKKHFSNLTDLSLMVIYLERFSLSRWDYFADRSDGNHSDMNILSESLPLINTNLHNLVRFISKVKNKYPEGNSHKLMANNILLKIKSDDFLRKEVLNQVSVFFEKPELKEMWPVFLKGAINDDPKLFENEVENLLTGYPNIPLADILYALAVACPDNEKSVTDYYQIVVHKRNKKLITPAEYLNILLIKNHLDQDAIQYIGSLSALSRNKHEIAFLSDILISNFERHFQDRWFKEVALNIIPAPFPELVANFNNLLTVIVGNDPKFVYDLLKRRFIVNGAVNFLDDPWDELPEANKDLFEECLVDWFITGTRRVHLAIQYLSFNVHLSPDLFQLSQKSLVKLSTIDKFYLACKITGYVYDKKIMRSLLFSLTSAVSETETVVLDELYNIFTGYVIYNYRSTLDEVKKIVTHNNLPSYLIQFYQRIINHFEDYFKGLDQVPSFLELRPDKELVEHINFYTSKQVSEQLKKSQKEGFADLVKTVTVNSRGWAIRRIGQKNHTPSPLKTVHTNMEFPAGEILNPVSSERFRKIYQLLEKDEININ